MITLASPQTVSDLNSQQNDAAYGLTATSVDTLNQVITLTLTPGNGVIAEGDTTSFTPDTSGDFPSISVNFHLGAASWSATNTQTGQTIQSGSLTTAQIAALEAAMVSAANTITNPFESVVVALGVFPAGAVQNPAAANTVE